jgi:hypothetical protein
MARLYVTGRLIVVSLLIVRQLILEGSHELN